MFWSALAALVAFAAVEASPQFLGGGGNGRGTLIRFGCSQIVIDRIDPLVNPGQIPSSHMHQIVGGNAFNASMPSTDISKLASCTTCSFTDDLSNYWTANMYFKAKNGSFKRVPQVPNRLLFGDRFTTQTAGGVTVYYVSTSKGNAKAFKEGFRMLFGDAGARAKKGNGMKSQSCFRCFTGSNFAGDNASPCADSRSVVTPGINDPHRQTRLDTETFPATPCPGGIRSNIHFPTCWDGVNLDSPNHQDHVAYPVNGPSGFTAVGNCPASHPVKIPQLMLEIVWDTTAFNNKADWPTTGQPFVLSTGDTTGYGQHADYVFGWKGDALQRAMDGGCMGASCANLPVQAIEKAKQCSVPALVNEDKDGWLQKLPGTGM